jgi:hypothetical protein
MAREALSPLSQPIFHEPVFGQDGSAPAANIFLTQHPNDGEHHLLLKELQKKDLVAVPESRIAADAMFSLAEAYGDHGAQVVAEIEQAGKIIFHAFGDSGAVQSQSNAGELHVAQQVTLDCATSPPDNRPAFLYQLGDLVYYAGEANQYVAQFYDPFRNYPAPIFAIPGNHDSFVKSGTLPGDEPLTTFQRNFCNPQHVITPEAGSLHRTAMTQPGVYFTLDAPFVRIIGLFSNALGDPGVISNLDGNSPGVSNIQIDFLRAQLRRIKQQNYSGAVLLAVHHPPFTYQPPPGTVGAGGNHAPSTVMLQQIDTLCTEEGVYPHAFLSGHSHNYQRYTRIIEFGGKEINVPFIVCGDGGHAVDALVRGQGGPPVEPPPNADVLYLEGKDSAVKVNQLRLAKFDQLNYGYLRIFVDNKYLKIGFHQVNDAQSLSQSRFDLVTVRLEDHHMVAN